MSDSDFSWSIEHSAILRRFDCAPSEITSRMRLRPARALSAGDPIKPGSTTLARISLWVRRSREWKGDTTGVNAGRHLRGLARVVDEMHARKKVIARLVPPGEFYFYSVLHTNSPNVCIGLPLKLARKIAELNAEWTCSLLGPSSLAALLDED